jgi:hypothetical protein
MKKSVRFFTWEDYGISKQRKKELKMMCQDEEWAFVIACVAHLTNEMIAEYMILSVTKNKTYEDIEYVKGLGRIPCGRTDFYGYRRLFYHLLDEEIKQMKGIGKN